MRRSRQNGEQSLELLLDTICNVFGGIIFIAILVALLTSTRSQQLHDAPAREVQRPDAAEAFELRSRIDELERALEELSETTAVVDDEERQVWLTSMARLGKELAREETHVELLAAWLGEQDEAWRDHLGRLEEQVEQVRERVARHEQTLRELEAIEPARIRLPMERATHLRQIPLLLEGGRAYPIPFPTAAATDLLRRHGLDAEVSVESAGGGGLFGRSGGYRFTPVEGGGLPLAAGAVPDELERLMASASPARHLFDLFVRPDSVSAFRHLRERAVERGFHYNVRPMEADAPLILYPGTRAWVQ